MKKIFVFFIILFCFSVTGQDRTHQAEIIFIYASSTLTDNPSGAFPFSEMKIRYAADKAFDNDPATAWSEGSKGAGLGESIHLVLDETIIIDQLKVMPGFFNEKYFKANNRVRQLLIENEDGLNHTLDFQDAMKEQTVKLSSPLEFRELTITILNTFRGEKWDDSCIAEIAFYRKSTLIDIACGRRIEYANSRYILPEGEISLGEVDAGNNFTFFEYILKPDGTLDGGMMGVQGGVDVTDGTWAYIPEKACIALSYDWERLSVSPIDPGPVDSGSSSRNFYVLGALEDIVINKNVPSGLLAGKSGPFIKH